MKTTKLRLPCFEKAERIKRPILITALTFLGINLLFLPLYQSLFLPMTMGERTFWVVGTEMLLLLGSNLLIKKQNEHKTLLKSFLVLLILSSAAAILCAFLSLECTIGKVMPYEGKTVELTAKVQEWNPKPHGNEYLFSVCSDGDLKGLSCKVRTYREAEAEVGDTVTFSGKVDTDVLANERANGIFFRVLTGQNPIKVISSKEPIREKLFRQTELLYSPPVRGLVQGVLFGERTNLESQFQEMMKQAGLAHILAVSGLHLSLMAFALTKFLQKIGLSRQIAGMISLFAVWGYAALAQFSPSAVRAGIVVTVGVVGYLLHRESDLLSSLSAAFIFMVALQPYVLYSVSFELSFFITFGIILCTKPISYALSTSRPVSFLFGKVSHKTEKYLKNLFDIIAASLAAMIFSAPLVLWYFHNVSFWSVLSAILALWAVAPLLITALLSILLGLFYEICPIAFGMILAKSFAFWAGIFARWILLVSKGIAKILHGVFYSHSIPVFMSFCVMAVLSMMMVYRFSALKDLQRRRQIRCAFCGSVLCICSVVAVEMGMNRGVLQIFATENACIFTRDGQGAVIGNVGSVYEANKIDTILRCEGVDELEMVLCSEADTDYSAGMDSLLQNHSVKTAILPQSGQYTAFIEQILQGQKIYSPEGICVQMLGGVTVKVEEGRQEICILSKERLKDNEKYDIIGQSDSLAMTVGGCRLHIAPECSYKVVPTLNGEPVLKIRM